MVERLAVNEMVPGSSPGSGANWECSDQNVPILLQIRHFF